jgi:malonyl CoA-acyl carrier protein transacylase
MPFYPTDWEEVSILERIALLFPGQGSQYIGMAKKPYKQPPDNLKLFINNMKRL